MSPTETTLYRLSFPTTGPLVPVVPRLEHSRSSTLRPFPRPRHVLHQIYCAQPAPHGSPQLHRWTDSAIYDDTRPTTPPHNALGTDQNGCPGTMTYDPELKLLYIKTLPKPPSSFLIGFNHLRTSVQLLACILHRSKHPLHHPL